MGLSTLGEILDFAVKLERESIKYFHAITHIVAGPEHKFFIQLKSEAEKSLEMLEKFLDEAVADPGKETKKKLVKARYSFSKDERSLKKHSEEILEKQREFFLDASHAINNPEIRHAFEKLAKAKTKSISELRTI